MEYLLTFVVAQIVFGFWLAHSIERGQVEVGQDDGLVDYLLLYLVMGAFAVIDLLWLCYLGAAFLMRQPFSWHSYG